MRNSIPLCIVLLAIVVAGGCTINLPQVDSRDDGGTSAEEPTLTITRIPAYGSEETLKGRVDNIRNHWEYGITAHLTIDDQVWWGKPYADSLLTYLDPDLTFEVDVTTGDGDTHATAFWVCVVPVGYIPELHRPPPPEDALASVRIDRPVDGEPDVTEEPPPRDVPNGNDNDDGEDNDNATENANVNDNGGANDNANNNGTPPEAPLLIAEASANDLTITQGEGTTLRGSAAGGTPPYTYSWSAPAWGGSTDQNPIVNPLETTTYALTVTDSSLPPQTDTDTVTVTTACTEPDLSFLQGALNTTVKTINLAPTHFDPAAGRFPTEDEIRADLSQLYNAGFHGVLTFDVDQSLSTIPEIAKEVGFQTVGTGIWDITNQAALDRAVGIAISTDFYIVGSEGLLAARYTKAQLLDAIEDVRNRTCKPVTTAEPWNTLLENTDLFGVVDFVCVNIYGWWEGAHDPQGAVDVLMQHLSEVQDAAGDKGVLVRETGFPTGGHPDASVCKQDQYFELLEDAGVPFAYFEAYDQIWKHEMCEGYDVGTHWGLYEEDGPRKVCESTHPPVADDQSVSTPYQTPVGVTLTAADPDGDPLTYSIVSDPSNGTLSGSPPTVTYTPSAGFSGQESFAFQANDGELDSNVATVRITVEEPGQPTIGFTYVPSIGDRTDNILEGTAYNVDYSAYKVVVYIKVDGLWWVKPYLDWPLTPIQSDGRWSCVIVTGGHDEDATEIRAYVVRANYDADLHLLPSEDDYVALTSVER